MKYLLKSLSLIFLGRVGGVNFERSHSYDEDPNGQQRRIDTGILKKRKKKKKVLIKTEKKISVDTQYDIVLAQAQPARWSTPWTMSS